VIEKEHVSHVAQDVPQCTSLTGQAGIPATPSAYYASHTAKALLTYIIAAQQNLPTAHFTRFLQAGLRV